MTARDHLADDPVPERVPDLTRLVAAVIVSYNCYTSIERTILAVASQVSRVIIVDNGSEPETLAAIRNVIERNQLHSCELLPQGRNLGIGAALNIGVRAALAAGAEYVLPLDDDTEFFPGTVAKLVRCSLDHEGRHVVAARWITPSNSSGFDGGQEDAPRYVEQIPSTGCLIPREAFESAGMFREDYFLDYTDYEYYGRLVDAGWRGLCCPTATVFHRPGNVILRRFFGRRVAVSNYPAERLFLLCRNGFVLYISERPSARYLGHHCRVVAIMLATSILYERDKFRKASAIIRGSVHGLLGNLGPPTHKESDCRIRRLDGT